MTRQEKWDLRFLRLAREISFWSKDPSTQVGCVIASDNEILSMGYNGFPKGDEDLRSDYLDREIKYSKVKHAETNALERADLFYDIDSQNIITIYTYPFAPCEKCAQDIVDHVRIKRMVSIYPSEDIYSRWRDSLEKANEILSRSGIIVKLYDKLDILD